MISFIVWAAVLWLVIGASYTLGTYDNSQPSYRKVIKDNILKAVVLSPVAMLKSIYDKVRNK